MPYAGGAADRLGPLAVGRDAVLDDSFAPSFCAWSFITLLSAGFQWSAQSRFRFTMVFPIHRFKPARWRLCLQGTGRVRLNDWSAHKLKLTDVTKFPH